MIRRMLVLALLVGCHHAEPPVAPAASAPAVAASAPAASPFPPRALGDLDALESRAILERAPVTQRAKVRHILVGDRDHHGEDPRGAKRTRKQLEKVIGETLEQIADGGEFVMLMAELSEDEGSARSGKTYDVTPDAGLVPPFKDLSLRLAVGEVGVVLTKFGFHIIQRVE